MEIEKHWIPTGVQSFDPVIKGGFPAGAFVLLLSEVGAGGSEFMYSSILMLAQLKKEGVRQKPNYHLPERIVYISFTKSRENVLQSISTLNIADISALEETLTFVDLSSVYFAKTQVPLHWTTDTGGALALKDFKSGGRHRSLFEALIDTLETLAPHSLVVIDSLTDLLRSSSSDNLSWADLVSLLKGIERMSKLWNATVYASLTANIFEPCKEEEVMDCVDGVLVFGWQSTGANQRQRMMYIKKFRGLMPFLEEDNVVQFETRVSASHGFEMSNIREIIGR